MNELGKPECWCLSVRDLHKLEAFCLSKIISIEYLLKSVSAAGCMKTLNKFQFALKVTKWLKI